MTPDYYSILQVHCKAEQEVIEAAYRCLAKKYHPDVNRSSIAQENMRLLNQAFEVLGDSRRRQEYDTTTPHFARQRSNDSGWAATAGWDSTGEAQSRDRYAPSRRSEPYDRWKVKTSLTRILFGVALKLCIALAFLGLFVPSVSDGKISEESITSEILTKLQALVASDSNGQVLNVKIPDSVSTLSMPSLSRSITSGSTTEEGRQREASVKQLLRSPYEGWEQVVGQYPEAELWLRKNLGELQRILSIP